MLWASTGLLPEKLRRKLGWEWTKSDQIRFFLFSRATRAVFSVLPRKARMVPIATRAFEKAEAR